MSDLSASVQKMLEAANSFNFLKAFYMIDLPSEHPQSTDIPLYKHLGQFYFNYHSALTSLSPRNVWEDIRLNANTPEFRNLDNKSKFLLISEEERIRDLFNKSLSTDKDFLVICLLYANYWIGLADGFRVALWLYRALEEASKIIILAEDFMTLKDDLYEAVIVSIDKTTIATTFRRSEELLLYVEFENISKYIESNFDTTIANIKNQFIPKFRDFLQLTGGNQ